MVSGGQGTGRPTRKRERPLSRASSFWFVWLSLTGKGGFSESSAQIIACDKYNRRQPLPRTTANRR